MALIPFFNTVLFLIEISKVMIGCEPHTRKYSITKYLFIHFTSIYCIPGTDRGSGDTMVRKRIKQRYLPLRTSSMAAKTDL